MIKMMTLRTGKKSVSVVLTEKIAPSALPVESLVAGSFHQKDVDLALSAVSRGPALPLDPPYDRWGF
ncbi:hypothetical protein AKJ37_01515 [candidate division MSBL1 archaeon SCGC-AAA259I09]|uniref:Uncharacterized protein n=1 Tax=candidate division MSBL1 archaeon SCGC-AAA259I09 TaxID=1698267 RepID=A0A133UV31_9EURY|nr:hypothetical protein AKJ37_01515 [candidate division MSBL1 archaeon SCGC-AAA259I09]